jgi:hypothetical protein
MEPFCLAIQESHNLEEPSCGIFASDESSFHCNRKGHASKTRPSGSDCVTRTEPFTSQPRNRMGIIPEIAESPLLNDCKKLIISYILKATDRTSLYFHTGAST